MTDELKPVAEVTKDEDLRWLPASSKRLAGSKLYAIPPTHRVVSVAQLERLLEVIAWPDHPAAIQLRAIIDNPAEEYQK